MKVNEKITKLKNVRTEMTHRIGQLKSIQASEVTIWALKIDRAIANIEFAKQDIEQYIEHLEQDQAIKRLLG